MERKTHPSFLRGWDVSDKDSELTLVYDTYKQRLNDTLSSVLSDLC